MQYTIQIPKPCHESWDAMTPEQGGRHCAQCCKTVVDFSDWQPEDILDYMQQQGRGNVCGRFTAEQLNVPITAGQFVISVQRSSLPFYKQIAAIFLFAFGMLQMSYDTNAQTPAKQTTHQTKHLTGKPAVNHQVVGLVAPQPPEKHDTTHKVRAPKTKHTKPATPDRHHIMGGPLAEPYPEHLQGDVMIEPVHVKNDTEKKK